MLEPTGLGSIRFISRDYEIGLLGRELILETLSFRHRTMESDSFL